MTLKNYSYIPSDLFYDYDLIPDGVVDGLWCQSASSLNESVGGGWYTPNGKRVNFSDTEDTPLHQMKTGNQFVLLRDGPIAPHEGLFECIIPHSSANMSVLVIDINDVSTYNQSGTV